MSNHDHDHNSDHDHDRYGKLGDVWFPNTAKILEDRKRKRKVESDGSNLVAMCYITFGLVILIISGVFACL